MTVETRVFLGIDAFCRTSGMDFTSNQSLSSPHLPGQTSSRFPMLRIRRLCRPPPCDVLATSDSLPRNALSLTLLAGHPLHLSRLSRVSRVYSLPHIRRRSLLSLGDGGTRLQVSEDAFDLLQGAAEVFSDLRRQHVRVR